jgi:IS5 family transposase
MQLFEDLILRFEKPDWSNNPEFGLVDTILERNPHLFEIVSGDLLKGSKSSNLGRQDVPSVEQIVRAGIFKEIRGLDYRELEYAQSDSRICEIFLKLDQNKPYSFSTWQKYISRIDADSLHKLLVEINKIAIMLGMEDVERLRTDTTVIETNIHYPTNNSLVWDCIREAHRLLSKLSEECPGMTVRDYTKGAKKNYFTINNTHINANRAGIFKKQLTIFTKSIRQVDRVVKKKAVLR